MSDRYPEAPEGKQINGFNGEVEDKAPLVISASPADQRILAAPPHTDPLPELIERAVNARVDDPAAGVNLDEHHGPSLTEDPLPGETPLPIEVVRDTPNVDISAHLNEETAGGDAGANPPNDAALDDASVETRVGTDGDGIKYPGLDTAAYNESLEARAEAEAESKELPEIEPPVPGNTDEEPEAASTDGEQLSLSDQSAEPTKAELLEEAKELDIAGRSTMSKEELVEAIQEEQTNEA